MSRNELSSKNPSRNTLSGSKTMRIAVVAGLAFACGSSMVLTGCSKPPPPPVVPPPPPPPPAPPADLKLDTVAQEMKADARVQFASSVTLSEEQLGLAKAIIQLSDALARGDDKAMKPLLTRKGQAVLDELIGSGGWVEATKKIEAVRVVLVREGVDVSGVSKAPRVAGIEEQLKSLPEEAREMVRQQLATLTPDQLDATFETMSSHLKAAGISDDDLTKMKDAMQDNMEAMQAAKASHGSALGVLVAVQDPQGAYLLGWAAEQAGEQWVFSNAPAMPEVRPRASLFDGIGPEGFREVQLAAMPVTPVAPPKDSDSDVHDSGGGGSSPPSTPSSPSAPATPAPTRKNTPAGPVTIPGKRPSPGGG